MRPELDEVLIRRYLLGDLSDVEREQVEELYFSDSDRFELLSVVEDELLDDYLAGRLSSKERELCERNYLTSPRRLKRLKFAQSLAQLVSHPRAALASAAIAPGRSRWRQALMSLVRMPVPVPAFALALALPAVILGLAWLVHLHRQMTQMAAQEAVQRHRVDQLQQQLAQRPIGPDREPPRTAQQNPPEASGLKDELARLRSLAATIFVVPLAPGADTRASGTLQPVAIPPSTQLVALRLPLDPQTRDSTYRAIVRNPERGVLWDHDPLHPDPDARPPVLTVYLPAGLLVAGEYSAIVTPSNDPDSHLAEFSFRIAKR